MGGDSVAASQLRAFIERAERMNEEKAAINEDLKEIFAEARGNGFDVKVMKAIISDRAKDPDKKSEFDEIYDLYASALGMRIATRAGAHEDDDQEDDVVVSDTIDRDGNRLRVSVDPRIAAILARTTENTTPIASVPAGFDPETGEEVTTPDEDEFVLSGEFEIIPDETPEPQPAPAARDLTGPQALNGQVATHTPEMADSGEAVVSAAAAVGASPAIREAEDIGSQPAGGENVAGHPSEDTVEKSDFVDDLTRVGATTSSDVEPVAPSNITQLRAPKPLRPNCLKPTMCGASGPVHCWSCVKALGERKEAAQ